MNEMKLKINLIKIFIYINERWSTLASNNVHKKLMKKSKKCIKGYPKTKKNLSLGLSYIDRVYSGVYDPSTQKLTIKQKGGSPVSYIVNKYFLLKHLKMKNSKKSLKKCLRGGSDRYQQRVQEKMFYHQLKEKD